MEFKEVLKSLRKEKSISQDELASLLKISRSTVAMYEQGRREPDFETLEKIADFFNVDMAYLLGKQLVKHIEYDCMINNDNSDSPLLIEINKEFKKIDEKQYAMLLAYMKLMNQDK